MTETSARIRMYATETCPYCMAARMLFKRKGLDFEEISVSSDADQRAEMERLSGRRSVPQIFIDGTHVGGFDDIDGLDNSGRLDEMLADGADGGTADSS